MDTHLIRGPDPGTPPPTGWGTMLLLFLLLFLLLLLLLFLLLLLLLALLASKQGMPPRYRVAGNHFLHGVTLYRVPLTPGSTPKLASRLFHLIRVGIKPGMVYQVAVSCVDQPFWGVYGPQWGMPGNIHLFGSKRELGFGISFGFVFCVGVFFCFVYCYCPLPISHCLLLIVYCILTGCCYYYCCYCSCYCCLSCFCYHYCYCCCCFSYC